MSGKSDERILCAAIHFDDGNEHVHQPVNIERGFVVCGLRHPNCYATLSAFGFRSANFQNQKQGFLASANRFVDRREGLRIARDGDQVREKHTPDDQLMSEDLY